MQSARLSVQSSELGPPNPSPAISVVPLPFGSKGGDTLACGGGGPNSNEGTDTLVLYVHYDPSTVQLLETFFLLGGLDNKQNSANFG